MCRNINNNRNKKDKIMENFENVTSEIIPLNTPTKVVVPKGILIKVKKLDMKQNQFEFKPFDKVLVRDYNNEPWRATHYSHLDNDLNHYCGSSYWGQCIPYNEETAHLLGTTQPYEPAKPKEYHVSWGPDSEMQQTEYTAEELENFIKTAVIHNKNISNFTVRRINN